MAFSSARHGSKQLPRSKNMGAVRLGALSRRTKKRRASAARVMVSIFSLAFLLMLVMAHAARADGVGSSPPKNAGAVAASSAGLGAAGSDVITITSKNYKQTIKEGTWFIKFYTNWCSHCKKLKPTWEEVATELKGKVNVGQINCEVEGALCRRFHVKGYPMLVHLRNGRPRAYKKERSKEALIEYAVSGYAKTPAVSALKSPFGPIENLKAIVVESAIRVKRFVIEKIRGGTPIWVVGVTIVAMLAAGTVLVAFLLVTSTRLKDD